MAENEQESPVGFIATIVSSGRDGKSWAAATAVCPRCGNDSWHLFTLIGHDHEHKECALCHTSYCPGGMCADPAVEPIDMSKPQPEIVEQLLAVCEKAGFDAKPIKA